jgi:hypothetical protein
MGLQHGSKEVTQSRMVTAEKHSTRVTNNETKIMDKAQTRKIKANELGKNSDPFSIFNSFQPSHFVNVSQACSIEMGNGEVVIPEIISIMEAQEKAQAMLNEPRIRKEREL